MNLRFPTASTVYIARPAPATGGMGGVGEAFAKAHQAMTGRLLPQSGALKAHAAGVHAQETLSLLLPTEADILPGDGVGLAEGDFPYRVLHVARYPLHVCAQLERRAR